MNAPRRVGRTLCEAFAEEERRKEQVTNEYEEVMGWFDWCWRPYATAGSDATPTCASVPAAR
jgi:hypothetical protein